MRFSLVIVLCLCAFALAVAVPTRTRKPIYIYEDDDDESEVDIEIIEEDEVKCNWKLDRDCPRGSIKYRYPLYNYGWVLCCERVWYPYSKRSAKG